MPFRYARVLYTNTEYEVVLDESCLVPVAGQDELYVIAGGPPSGAAGGDLAGTYPNPTLAAIGSAATKGTASKTPTVTIDTKGRVTGLSEQSISITPTQAGLGNVDNVQQLPMSYLDTDGTLSANSDTRVPSQKAVKTYVDASGGGGGAPSGPAGGDLTGTYPNPTLAVVSTAATKGSASKTVTATIDTKGRVTSLTDQDIAIAESQVTNLTTDLAGKLPLTGGSMTGNITFDGVHTVTGIPAPVSGTQAANKAYVDSVAGGATPGLYMSAYDTSQQLAAAINTGYAITVNTPVEYNGISMISSSRFRVAGGGVFNIQFSAQFINADTQIHNARIWIEVNEVSVPYSAGDVAVPNKHGSVNGALIAGWNYVMSLNAGDDVEFYWQTDNTNVYMDIVPDGASPVSPSMIVTLQQVASTVAGPTGPAGTSLLYGAGAPSSGTGSNGDFYINTSTNYLYGPKAAGVWPAGTPLTAGTGPAGGDLAGTYPNPTLAVVATAATKGTAAKSATVTIDAKGRVTSITDQDIAITKAQAGLANVDNTADASKSVLYATTAGGAPPTGTAGGDLAGTYPNPTLAVVTTAATKGSSTNSVTVTVDANGRVTSLTESAIVATDSTKLPLAGGTMTGTLVLRTGSNTAGTAPVKFVSGFLLTSPEAGAVEFLNDDLLLTITTGTARKRLALCDASLTSGKMPYATTNGRLTDASTLYWDAANSRLGIGPSAPVAKLDVGTNFRFVVYPDYAGLGDIGASSTLIGSYAGDLAFFAETGSGTTGKKTIFAYFNGTTVKSAMEVANTTGGTTSTLELMKGGGNVNVGASASVAARNAVTVKNTSANAAAEAGFYATSEVGNAFFGMTSNASSRTVAGLVISAEAGSTFPMTFWTNGSRRMTITGADGYLALNRSTATARLHIAAGSASATTAPLKFDSGTLMSTPETGAVEFLTDDLLFTITTGSARKRIALCDAALTSGRVTFATTNGRLSDSANLTFTSPDLFLSAASGTRSLYFGSSTSYNSLTSLNDGSLDLYFGTTATNRGYRFSWQTDRNVVLYSGATPIWTTGTATSDRRLKDNIQPTATPGIDTIKQLEVVDFNWKAGSDLDDGGKLHTGLIAQDVAEIIPDAVKDSGGTLLLHKEELVPVLLKALQEAVARIEVLEQALAQKGGQ